MMALFEASTRGETSSSALVVVSMSLMFGHFSAQNSIHQLNKCIFQIACKFNPTSFGMHKTTQSVLSQAF